MSWAEAIKAALISIPKLIELGEIIAARLAEIRDENKALRKSQERVVHWEAAKEAARGQADSAKFNELVRNPPRFD